MAYLREMPPPTSQGKSQEALHRPTNLQEEIIDFISHHQKSVCAGDRRNRMRKIDTSASPHLRVSQKHK